MKKRGLNELNQSEQAFEHRSKEAIQEIDLESARVESVLSPETRQRLEEWSDNWIHREYEHSKSDNNIADRSSLDTFNALKDFEHNIAVLTGTESEYEKYPLPPLAYQEGARIFLEHLIDFMGETALREEEKQQFSVFVAQMNQQFFSCSPSIGSYVGSVSEQIILTSKANRIPEIQGWLGQGLVGESTYSLNFTDYDVSKELVEKSDRLSVAEILDLIDQLLTIGINAWGNRGWANRAFANINTMLSVLAEHYKSPLIGYAVENALQRLADEQEQDVSTLSFDTYHGNTAAGRIHETLTENRMEEHQNIARAINPDHWINGGRFSRVAKDAVSEFDQSGLPRFIGRVDTEEVAQNEQPISIVDVRNVITAVQRVPKYVDDFVNILDFIDQRVLQPAKDDHTDSSNEPWSKIEGLDKIEGWHQYLHSRRAFEDLREQFNNALRSGQREFYDENELWESAEGQSLTSAIVEISNQFELFQEKVLTYLNKIEAQLVEVLPSVEFKDYRCLTADGEINPFAGGKDEKKALLLQHLHKPNLRQNLEKDLGIDLSKISVRSQIPLLFFLSSKNEDDFVRLKGALGRHPKSAEKILSSFIACNEDLQYGEAILTLAENLDENIADRVFSKYEEITKALDEIRFYLYSNFGLEISGEQNYLIARSLLHKGNELLSSWAATVKEKGSSEQSEYILSELENIKTDLLLFATSFRTAIEEDAEIEFSDIVGTELQSSSAVTLSEADKEEMRRIFKGNRATYTPKLLEATTSELNSALENEQSQFYILRHQNDIAAFVRFDEEAKEKKAYVGSLNVDPNIKGSSLGGAMLSATLDRYAQNGYTVYGYVNPDKTRELDYYQREYGFEAVGEEDHFHAGIPFIKIERRPDARLKKAA